MRLPRTVHNPLSYVGAVVAALALLVFLFLMVLNTVTGAGRAPYAGLVIFMLIPGILILGLILIPIGMYGKWRRIRDGRDRDTRFPLIDLNDPHQLNGALVFVVGSVLLLFLSAFGSYQAYNYTDSVSFCGTLCHKVMNPEYTTYLHSPHARVKCVECHVGPGADWFVRYKLSGLYQVYAATFNKFPRPIPTPIENLRPAQETCEECHWPQQFFGGQQKRLVHFLPDEKNTPWEVNLLIKTGGGSPQMGTSEGIHWHMNIANKVEYVATDDKRQVIPWVRMTNRQTGQSSEYRSMENPISDQQLASARIRTMDCVDCHNRPTHIFYSPAYAMNLALSAKAIDPSLPSIKSKGVELLAAKYETTESALNAIDRGVKQFYRQNHPDLFKRKEAAITRASAEIGDIYSHNFFPEMKTRWDDHTDNVGHLTSPGCFRCHDELHKSGNGKTISRNCDSCHTILSQGEAPNLTHSSGAQGIEFQHPGDAGDAWKEMKCSDCHTGQTP